MAAVEKEAALRKWCALANSAAYSLTGNRNNCIAASLALVECLRRDGIAAEPFRAEAHAALHPYIARIYSEEHLVDTVGDGPMGSVGWVGHLAVSCGEFVADPTIDQMCVDLRRPAPAVFRKPPRWHAGDWYEYDDGDLVIRHRRHDLQIGWKSKPAARRSQYMQVVDLMISLRAGNPDLTPAALP